jgi:hypothetical protein
MPVHVAWLLENHIIETAFEGEVTVEDIQAASAEIKHLFEQSDGTAIHVLHDYSSMTHFPMNMKLLSIAGESSLRHPRHGWIVAHSIKVHLARFLAMGASQLTRTKLHVANTRIEALAFLASIDPALPKDIKQLAG